MAIDFRDSSGNITKWSISDKLNNAFSDSDKVNIKTNTDLQRLRNMLGGNFDNSMLNLSENKLKDADLEFKGVKLADFTTDNNRFTFDVTQAERNLKNKILNPNNIEEVPEKIEKLTGQAEYGEGDINSFRDGLNALGRPDLTIDLNPSKIEGVKEKAEKTVDKTANNKNVENINKILSVVLGVTALIGVIGTYLWGRK